MKTTRRFNTQLISSLWLALACLATVGTCDDFNPVLVGKWPGDGTGGSAYSVAVSSSFAYLATGGNGLQVIDISDPANPYRAGCYSEPTWCVAVSGDYAYVGAEAGLQVIDISDPANPRKVGSCDTSVSSVAVSDNYACVTYFSGGWGDPKPCSGLQVIDISDPAKPRALGNLVTSHDYGGGLSVAAFGGYAYVADGWAGLHVIDVSDPANPQRMGGVSGGGMAQGVAVSADFAYVAGSGWPFRVIDVSDPTTPRVLGELSCYGMVFGVAVSGNYAYVADESGVLRVIDVSDPTHPRELGHSSGSYGEVLGVAVVGQLVFLASSSQGLVVLRAAFQPEGRLIHRQPTDRTMLRGDAATFVVTADPGISVSYQWEKDGVLLADDRRISSATGARLIIRDVEVSDAGAYTVTLTDALNKETSHPAKLEISQPRKVSLVGSVDIPRLDGWSRLVGVDVSGNHAYCTSSSGNDLFLQVIDVSNPALPQRVGTCKLTGKDDWWAPLVVSGAHAYVASDGGLEVVEVMDPTAPRTLGWCPTTGQLRDVAVSGEHAFLADGSAGGRLVVVRITDPTHLQVDAEYHTGGPALQVALSGQYAFVTVRPQPGPGDRLLVLDISDPASPRLVGECPTHSYSWGKIAVGNQHLYVGGSALSVINIADPVNPQQVGEYRGLFGEMWSTLSVLGIWADRAYVVRGRDLFEVLDLSDPARPQAIGKWDTTQYQSVIVSGTVTGNLVYVLADTRLEIYSSGPLVQIPPSSIQVLAGGEFGFRISGEQGQQVEVQASEHFGAWTTINAINNTDGHTDLADPVGSRDRRFYRLQLKE